MSTCGASVARCWLRGWKVWSYIVDVWQAQKVIKSLLVNINIRMA